MKSPTYTTFCDTCKSTHVQIQAWINPNTGEVLDWCNDGRGWCDKCEDEVYTNTLEVPASTRAKAANR